MCEWQCGYANQERVQIGAREPFYVDRCLVPLVKALWSAGFTTVASCCGHGHRPGNIALDDGRELIIAPDYESGRKIDAIFPDIHGNPPTKREIEK